MDETKPNNLASLLRDFAQGASNSVAGNVAVPVDAIAWLLRKGGVNVPPNPVMGSDWMAEKGLTREPQNKLAGLVGDMAGMVAPFAAATKAPQIAKGLLAAGEAMPEFAASAGRPANYLPKKIDQTGVINLGNERLLKILERNGESVAPKFPQSEALDLAQQRAALPLPPAGVDITKLPQAEARKYGLGLRSDNTALERANASKEADSIFDMNFNNDVYHGTNNADILKFDPSLSNQHNQYMSGTFTADRPELAGNFGDIVMPLKQTNGVGVMERRSARLAGDEIPTLDTIHDKNTGIWVTNNPDNLRSRFAAFDPWRRNAAIAATMRVAAPDLLAKDNNELASILKSRK